MLGVLSPSTHTLSTHARALGTRFLTTSATRASVRVRFAPSPTGSLHLGGLRTALANHLLAKNKGGTWLVRIEDTDRTRLSPGAVESLARTLAWAGLKPDAAPWLPPEEDKLQVGPYYQSERLPLYRAAALELVRQGKAYYDFRPPSEMGSAATGAYTPLPLEEARKLVEAGTPHTIRLFRPDKAEDLSYDDLIYGHLRFSTDVEFAREGDVVLLKRDGYPTYHLASVVDDHAMGITHVLRGEEWIASLPTHLRLYEALGYKPPQFAHLPLLMTADGRKLSKRHNDASVESYIERGYEPAAVVNFVALLGYNHKNRTDRSAPTYVPIVEHKEYTEDTGPGEEVFTLPQMEADFDLSRISSTRSSPDLVKLEFLNRAHIRFALLAGPAGEEGWAAEYATTIQRARKFLAQACGDALTTSDKTEERIRQLTLAFIERAHTLPEAAAKAAALLSGPDWDSPDAQEFRAGIDSEAYRLVLDRARQVVAIQPDDVDESGMAGLVDQIAVSLAEGKSSKERKKLKGVLMRSLRHAVAGEKVGPPLPSLLYLLGPRRLEGRLQDALAREQH